MFCQNCGAEATPGLNYCKRCGGNLNQSVIVHESHPVTFSVGSAWAIGVTTLVLVLGGLGVMMGTAIALVERGVVPEVVGMLGLFSALTLLGSVILLMRLWTKLLNAPSRAATHTTPAQLPKPTGGELGQARPAAPLPDYIPSVTEHTTRTFEPRQKER